QQVAHLLGCLGVLPEGRLILQIDSLLVGHRTVDRYCRTRRDRRAAWIECDSPANSPNLTWRRGIQCKLIIQRTGSLRELRGHATAIGVDNKDIGRGHANEAKPELRLRAIS